MKKIYFGAWQNFYHLNWPIRFLIEGIIFLLIIRFLYRLLHRLIQKHGMVFWLMSFCIKVCTWTASEVVYFLGRNSEWAVETDNKIIEWKEKKLEENPEGITGKKHTGLRRCMISIIVIIYVSAVFVDLPLSKYIQEEYRTEFAGVKEFFQRYEKVMSVGYESFPPLFVKSEPEETIAEDVVEIEEETEEPIYVQLNGKGRNGANVRRDPSLDGEVVGGVNRESEILYQYQWERDEEERYWIKIYIPAEGVEGWLSGKLVDSTQLETLVNEP